MALRWSQAEVLQIMEEIERVGAAALLPFFAARHTLEVACRRLLLGQRDGTPQQRAARLTVALGGSTRTVELDLANQVAALGRQAAADPAALAWLQSPIDSNGQLSLPAGAFGEAFEQFMALYGQRAIGEGEIAVSRWREDPATLVAALRAAAADERSAAPPLPADPAPLLAAVDSSQRKETLHLLERMRRAIELQSGGLHAFAFVLAGTRRWALAAGREATVDQRLLASEDVFFYELEEVKQMMTGEWNISDRSGIHATAGERRVQLAQAQQVVPADLLWGEREARRDPAVLPAAAGVASGMAADEVPSPGCVWGCPVGESAAAVLLPASAALLIAQGSLIDPLADCARALGRPAVVGAHLPGQGAAVGLSVDGNVGRVSSR
jgi:pyruvate,water dikinase